jgi:hypothetical protein
VLERAQHAGQQGEYQDVLQAHVAEHGQQAERAGGHGLAHAGDDQ